MSGPASSPPDAERIDVRDDAAVARFATDQGVTPEQVRWMIGKVGASRSRLVREARKLLDLD